MENGFGAAHRTGMEEEISSIAVRLRQVPPVTAAGYRFEKETVPAKAGFCEETAKRSGTTGDMPVFLF